MARSFFSLPLVTLLALGSFVACVTGAEDPILDDEPQGSGATGGTKPNPGKGGGTFSGGSGGGPSSGGGPNGTGGTGGGDTGCSYPEWQAGKDYGVGDKVTKNGKGFEATNPNPGYDPEISTWFWKSLGSCGSQNGTGGGNNGSGGTSPVAPGECALDKIMGKDVWEQMYSARRDTSFYTYDALCEAMQDPKLNGFANTGNEENDKRDAAAFFANVSRETGELQYIRQLDQSIGTYYGRGPLQITHDYNYRACGQALGLGDQLVQDPDLLATDKVLTWKCALWFWMIYNFNGNCHKKIVNEQDFGATIRIINGGIECQGPGHEGPPQRIGYYQDYTSRLGVDPGSKLNCY